jgi:hypothetical protein
MATGGLRGASVKPNNQGAPGPIGNTTGLIVPQTAPNPSGNSAPPIKPTKTEQSWWSKWGDVVHTALDVVGMIPVVGEVADGANALIYLAEGDGVNAALSAASMLPVGGQAATAAKWGKKGVEAAQDAAKAGKAGKAAAKAEKEAAEQAAKKETKEVAEEGAGAGGKPPKNESGGYSKGSRSGRTGKCGEKLAKQDMMKEGFDEVIEVQNNSGHGVDLIGRNSKTGEVKVWEVKTTEGVTAPPLRGDQAKLGGEGFVDNRLRKAVTGEGNYGKVPEAMKKAELAKEWIEDATGRTSYEKREVFIDDIDKGCMKHPSRPSRSVPWTKR